MTAPTVSKPLFSTPTPQAFTESGRLLLTHVLREVKGPHAPYAVTTAAAADMPSGRAAPIQYYGASYIIQRQVRSFFGLRRSWKKIARATLTSQRRGYSSNYLEPHSSAYTLRADLSVLAHPHILVSALGAADDPATLPMAALTPATLDKNLIDKLRRLIADDTLKL